MQDYSQMTVLELMQQKRKIDEQVSKAILIMGVGTCFIMLLVVIRGFF